MKITSISVEVRETVSLPGYCNATRGIVFTAKLGKHDVAGDCIAILTERAEDEVHHEVDDILEAAGEPPKFYAGGRFVPVYSPGGGCAAVVPPGYRALPVGWYEVKGCAGYRRETAQRLAMGAVHGGRYLGVLEDGDCLPKATDEECAF